MNEMYLGMNIYFAYNLTSGEIVSSYLGAYGGDWENLPDNCAVIGPFLYDTAPQIMIDAGEDTELYFINGGQVQIKPNAEAIKQARAANRVPTTEEQVSKLQNENQLLTSQNKALYDSVNFMMDYLITNGTIV